MQIKKIVIVLLMIFLITGCTKVNEEEKEEPIIDSKPTDVERFKREYTSTNEGVEVTIPDDSLVHYASAKEVLDILTNGTGIIYFGRPTCPWCRNAVSVILNVAKENNMTVNYYNPGEVTSDDIKDYVEVKNKLNVYLDTNDNGEKTLFIPDIYFVFEGKVVGHHLSTVNSQTDPYTAMTDTQKQELGNIYQNFINQMKEG